MYTPHAESTTLKQSQENSRILQANSLQNNSGTVAKLHFTAKFASGNVRWGQPDTTPAFSFEVNSGQMNSTIEKKTVIGNITGVPKLFAVILQNIFCVK